MTLGIPFEGAHQIEGPLTVVDAWQLLHTNAQEWLNVPQNSKFFVLRDMLDKVDNDTLLRLKIFDCVGWQHLCHGAGWTVMGAVGLSWCDGGTFEHVAGFWQQVAPSLLPDPFTLRAASMLNPKILPESKTLLGLVDALQNNTFQIALVIAATNGELKIDVSAEDLTNAPEALRPTLGYSLANSKNPAFQKIASEWSLDSRRL